MGLRSAASPSASSPHRVQSGVQSPSSVPALFLVSSFPQTCFSSSRVSLWLRRACSLPSLILRRLRASRLRYTLLSNVRHRLFPTKDERGHLSVHGLRWLYVGIALRNMTVLGVMSLMPVFLTTSVGVSDFVMGSILAVNAGGQAISMYLFGRVADRYGRKPLITGGMVGTALFGLVGSAAGIPDAMPVRISVATVGFVVLAGTYSALRIGSIVFVGDVASADRESELMGLLSTAKSVGGVVGPPLFGAMATVTSYQFTFAAGSSLALAAAGIVTVTVSESHPTV